MSIKVLIDMNLSPRWVKLFQDVLPDYLGREVCAVIKKQQSALEKGAMIVLDKRIDRVRILPF